MILQSLQRFKGPEAPREPQDLNSRLFDSLRTLLPQQENAAACSNSAEGQQLLQVVQGYGPSPAQPPAQQASPQPASTAEDLAGSEGEPIRLPPAHFGGLAAGQATPAGPPAELRPPQEIDGLRSGDGVPHRLPPGFAAIPQELVEERARQREEERMRQFKATVPCRFGRACKRRDCPQLHPEGREIDTALNLCSFGRRCKRKKCFYDHPEGREIDEDSSKGMCRFGKKCVRAECIYDHPEGREPVSSGPTRVCFFCHESGHIAGDCPRNPDSWAYNRVEDKQRRLIQGNEIVSIQV